MLYVEVADDDVSTDCIKNCVTYWFLDCIYVYIWSSAFCRHYLGLLKVDLKCKSDWVEKKGTMQDHRVSQLSFKVTPFMLDFKLMKRKNSSAVEWSLRVELLQNTKYMSQMLYFCKTNIQGSVLEVVACFSFAWTRVSKVTTQHTRHEVTAGKFSTCVDQCLNVNH